MSLRRQLLAGLTPLVLAQIVTVIVALEAAAHVGLNSRQVIIVIATELVGSILALVVSTLWISRLLRPLISLSAASRRIGQGDLGARALVQGKSDLAVLARDFNEMAERLENYRKCSLGQLLQAQQNLYSTIESVPDPIFVVDIAGALTQANRAAGTAFGVDSSSSDASWLASITPSLRELIQTVHHHVLLRRGPFLPQGLKDAVTVDVAGGQMQFLARGEPAYDADGSIMGTTILLQDVTRIVRLDELRLDLVATAAHEFRTPLTSIRMAIHLCAEGVVGPLSIKQSDLLFTARDECERLQNLVDELLDASRLNTGQLALHRENVPVDLVLSCSADALRATAEAQAVHLRTEVMPGIGEVFVDRDQINILLSNLINNAIHYSPAGAEVTARARRTNERIEFDVSDQGPGIAPEHHQSVFEPHFQVPNGHSGGAGLGLAIAKRIVAEHGGEIGVESALGAGARFWFRLPVTERGPPP